MVVFVAVRACEICEVSAIQPAVGTAAPAGDSRRRTVDVVLAGAARVGKSYLLRQLLADAADREALGYFDESSAHARPALTAHHVVRFSSVHLTTV